MWVLDLPLSIYFSPPLLTYKYLQLLSGYEQDPHLFYDVTAGLVALALIVTAYGFRRLMILRRVGLGRARRSKTGDHPPRWWTVALARYFRAGDAAAGKTL